ncbi:MAG: tetratricopeptide repeat protein [Anaerolineae bacterium]|nr:tetratricopeptide repeat protein [Anaerolineae bacterium]
MLLTLVMVLAVTGLTGSVLMPQPMQPAPRDGSPATFIFDLTVSRSDGWDARQHGALAGAYAAASNDAAAVAHLYVAAAESDDPALWRQVADRAWRSQRWMLARQALEAVIRWAPEDASARYRLAVLLLPYDARQAYEHLRYTLGDSALGARAAFLQAAVTEAASDTPADQVARIGMALAAQGHWPQAEQAFVTAIAMTPDYAVGWAYLGLARAQQGKNATDAFARALAYAPGDAVVLLLQGLAWRAQGDHERSLEALAAAQGTAPDDPAIAAELGTAYRLLGDLASAEYWLARAAQLGAGQPQFLTNLAFFYAEEAYNLTGNGLTVLAEAVARQPENADLQAAYGWALVQAGQVTTGEAALQTAMSLQPDCPRALYYQGLLYQLQGQDALAVETLARLIGHPEPQGWDRLARRVLATIGS